MGYFGIPFRNGVPIGLGSVASFGAQQFDPSSLFIGGTAGTWYDPSDLSTLFTTSAGTTQCAMPGQGSAVSVGAMLDKRAAGYSVYFDGTGDYLEMPNSSGLQIGGGPFTIEAWIYPTSSGDYRTVITKRFGGTAEWELSLNNTDNKLLFYTSSVYATTNQVNLNAWNHVAAAHDGTTLKLFVNGIEGFSGAVTITNSTNVTRIGASNPSGVNFQYFAGNISNVRVVKGTAVYTGNFTPPTAPLSPISGTSLLTCGTTWSGNPAITKNGDVRIDGLNPFTASPVGNHAIAFNDTTARPELRARVNLLTYSEEFDNAAWTKDGLNAFGSGSVANTSATTDPLGGNTADYIQENTANSKHRAYQIFGSSGVSYAFSCYMKAGQRTWAYLNFGDISNRQAWFDLANGVVGTVSAGLVASIQAVGNGWYRCTITRTASAGSPNFDVGIANADNVHTYTGDGTSGIYIWGAQLTATNEFPANTYQRIADANTYDTSGFPLYLRFDGIDDSMYTPANLNLSGTDKVAVFAGVRRNAAVTQFPVEFSAQSDANNSTFGIGNDSGGAEYFFNSRGTTLRQVSIDNAAYNAPVSNVVTLSADIAAPSLVARLNGAQVGSNTSSQGTGNYGTYPLYIGSRNNSVFFLNGHLYSLAVVGSAVSGGNIAAMESWVAGKTGIAI